MKGNVSKPWREQAELLLRKASQDQYIVDVHVRDDQCAVEVYGFHAQQAVEKMLKAVLALRRVSYPYTHLLDTLFDLVAESEPAVKAFDDLRVLTPFGAELPYGDIPLDRTPALDRTAIQQRIAEFRAWLETVLAPR